MRGQKYPAFWDPQPWKWPYIEGRQATRLLPGPPCGRGVGLRTGPSEPKSESVGAHFHLSGDFRLSLTTNKRAQREVLNYLKEITNHVIVGKRRGRTKPWLALSRLAQQ